MPHLTSCYCSLLSKEVVSQEFFKGEPLKVNSLADQLAHGPEAPPDQLRAALHQVVHLIPHPVHRVHRQVAHVVCGAHRHLPHVMGAHHRIPHCPHGEAAPCNVPMAMSPIMPIVSMVMSVISLV